MSSIPILTAGDTRAEYGTLHDYVTGEPIRPATLGEALADCDNKEGVFQVDGRSVYATLLETNRGPDGAERGAILYVLNVGDIFDVNDSRTVWDHSDDTLALMIEIDSTSQDEQSYVDALVEHGFEAIGSYSASPVGDWVVTR